MKLKNLFLGLLATAAVFASCQPSEEQLGAPALNLDPETMEFDVKAGEQELNLLATRDWAVANENDWIQIDPASGSGSNDTQKLTVTVLANPESDRTAELEFSIGMITKTLTVNQKGEKGEAALDVTSIAEFIKNADTQKVCTLKGTVSNVAKGDRFWGFDINDGTGTVTAAFPANWDSWKDQISNGGTVVVEGAYEYFEKKGTHQVKKCTIISFEAGEQVEAEQISVADFIKKADTQKAYRLKGTLEGLAKGDRFWGFDINDGTGKVTAAFPDNWDAWKDKLQDGGTVTVQGPYEYYEKKGTHQVKNCTILAFTAGGGEVNPDQPSGEAVFSESFGSSLGQFKVEDVNKPSELSDGVWQYSSKFKCAVATGYTGGKGGSKLTSESSIVSPEIDLTSVKEAYISFEQAGNYFKDAKAATSLEISKNGGDWTALAMDNSNLSGFTWKSFSLDITAYAGSKIKVRFHYKSTPENCGTWEIKDFAVMKGKYVAPVDPDEPEVPAGTKVVLKTNAKDMSFAAETDPTYGAGFAATKDGVKIGYYQHESTSAAVDAKDDHIRLYKSSAVVITLEKGGNFKYIKMLTTGGEKCVTYQAPKGEMVKVGDSVIWKGSAASPFVGEMVNGQIRVKEITIVY